MGDRALYHDGWMAGTAVVRPPWDLLSPARDPLDFPWELYDLRHDWTQSEHVANRYGHKLKELQGMFWEEAQRHQVLPLDSCFLTRGATPRPSPTAGRDTFIWTGELTVGADTGTGVDDGDYQVPLRFSGTLERLTLRIDQPKLTPEDERTLMEAQRNMEIRE